MANKTEIPTPSGSEAKQLTEAAGHAYSDQGADEFFNQVMDSARHYSQYFSDEQTRTE